MIHLPDDTAYQLLAAIREAVPWVSRREQRDALQFAGDRLATELGKAYHDDQQGPLFDDKGGERS